MTLTQLLFEAGKRGLILGRMFQTQYVLGGESRSDHWEAHFHDKKGEWCKGGGRTPTAAVRKALGIEILPMNAQPTTADEEGLM